MSLGQTFVDDRRHRRPFAAPQLRKPLRQKGTGCQAWSVLLKGGGQLLLAGLEEIKITH